MRDVARMFGLPRRVVGPLIALTATLTAFAVLGAPSALAAGLTIKTGFGNDPISLNTTDSVGYTITNTSSQQTVTFTDTLPAGVTLDDPVGTAVSGACTLNSAAATPGASAVTVSATVQNGSCNISFSIVATAPSGDAGLSDTYSGVSPAATTTPGSLTVLSDPTLSFTAPANGQAFPLGDIVNASFSCAATDPLDSIDSFFGTDDEGNQIESGAPIDTLDPGAHTLEVDCYSAAGGGDVYQLVNYSVGSYALTAVRETKKTDFVSFRTLVPAGRLVAKMIDGKRVIGTTTVVVPSRRTQAVTIKPTAAGRKLLAAVKRKVAIVKLQVAFTPDPIGSGDEEISPVAATILTRNVRLPIAHAAKKRPKKKAHAANGRHRKTATRKHAGRVRRH